MKCRHCGAKLSCLLIDLGAQPPSNSYISREDLDKPETFFPLRVYICDQCFLVQTADFTSRDTLFTADYAYFSSTSKTWLEHASSYATQMISELSLDKNSFVVEVASNDGYLLKNFLAKEIPCLGIEPTISTARSAKAQGIKTWVEFFGEDIAKKVKSDVGMADLIVCNNVFAHVPDLSDFTLGLAGLIKNTGVITIEVPHLHNLIRDCLFDTLYHEHYSYFSLRTVQNILSSAGLRIFRVEKLLSHGGSLRIYACNSEATFPEEPSLKKIISEEASAGLFELTTYSSFQSRAEEIKDEFLRFLLRARLEQKRVCAYGAAAKGNTLINFAGVKSDLLPFVSDAADSKINKYLPGSRIPILAPTELIDYNPDYLILLPWNIAPEIKFQFSGVLKADCKYVTFFPETKYV